MSKTNDRPLAAEINALPARMRQYVHDLETDADPAGDKQQLIVRAEQIAGLQRRVSVLRSELAAATSTLQSEFFGRVTYKTERNNALSQLDQLRAAAKMLAQIAMTSGGTAGPDPDLIRAIEGVTNILPIEGADVIARRTLESRAAKALITWRKRWERKSEPPDESGGWGDTMDIWRLAGLLIRDEKEKNRREAATSV